MFYSYVLLDDLCKWILSPEKNKVVIGISVLTALCLVHPLSVMQVTSNNAVCTVLVERFLQNDGNNNYLFSKMV